MKRVLDHTPSWAVVPVSVLGATCLLALAHTLMGSGTPPVARHESPSALSDPSPQLLPRMDSKVTGSANALDDLTNEDAVDSTRRLASSDADSVLAPTDKRRWVNTGWHPMNSDHALPARPVALVSTDAYIPQARMVAPAPRYGSSVPEWNEMPLVAPAEELPDPADSASPSLVNSLFGPPSMPEPDEEIPEPLPPSLAPLPPIESTRAHADDLATVENPVAETATEPMDDALILLPPVETNLLVPADSSPWGLDREPETNPLATEEALVSLPPVEMPEELPFDVSPWETADAELEPVIVAPEEIAIPLPPVDSIVTDSRVEHGMPTLIPLPPVEPRLLDFQGSLAIAMIEGLFQPIETAPKPNPNEQEHTTGEPADVPLEVADDEPTPVIANEAEEAPLPLPPVVKDAENVASASTEPEGPGHYSRSWELELIARQADKHSRRGFELASKKAQFSARLEFTRALRVMAQGLDTEFQTNRHSQALAAGLRALTEAEDFLPKDGHLEAELDLEVIAGAHRTPILHEADVEEMTPLATIQKYHAFAQEKLAESVASEVAGSMALCGLGKLHIAIANQHRGDGIAAATTKAMVLLQAALIASPGNHMAANELGVLLARNSRYGDARRAFEHSIAACPTAEAWRNLALTCEQLGDMDAAYEAAQQTLALRGNSTGKTSLAPSRHGAIRWVPPTELAKTSAGMRTASAAKPSQRPR